LTAGNENTFYVIGIILIISSLFFFLVSNKKLSLSVEEGLKKIKITEAMEICAGTRGADTRIVAPSESLDLEIALQDLSEDEGLPIETDGQNKRKYYHIIGWNDGSRNRPEKDQELKDGCTNLINNDEDFSKEFNRVWSKELARGNSLAAEERAKEEADRVRFAPQLEKWDNKLSELGSGGLRNYLQASAATEYLIRQGAAYSLTGVSRGAVQAVSCDATDRSFWSRGVPTGWWSCLIDFEGSDYELFSVEFTENSWRGVPDRGRQAGTDLNNIDIPQNLIEWLGRQK
jgi:hypothetical protein